MDTPLRQPAALETAPETTRQPAIAAAEQTFLAVANAAQDAIIAADDQGLVTFWNTAAEQMFGYSLMEMLGQPLSRIMPQRFRDAHANGLRRFVETGEARVIGNTVELIGLRREGAEFPIELTLGLARDGSRVTFTGIIRDITERHLAQTALRTALQVAEHANHAKSDFLARMSHELRTPLNSVIGFANVLLKNKNGHLQPSDLTYLQRIQANGRHLLSLINQILDLSKIEAGHVDVELASLDISELVTGTLAQFDALASERRIGLQLHRPIELAPLVSDEAKLRQVLFNLIGNAIKFTESGAVTMTIETEPESHRVVAIHVHDTGIGIPADRLGAIFEPFEQAETGTTRRFGGTGLGLTISRSLCSALGYDLVVASEVGRGTTFTIAMNNALSSLPSADDAAANGGADVVADARRIAMQGMPSSSRAFVPARTTPEIPERIVLVIDDDSDSRLLLMHAIEELDCRVLTAHSGEEGLRLAAVVRPSLITLDLMMPGMDGWETLRRLKSDVVTRDIPVVVISMAPTEERGVVIGAVDCLDKAGSHDALLTTLRNQLR